MTTLARCLQQTAADHPDANAVQMDDLVLTYRDLADRAATVAGWLVQQGVRPGDRVGIVLPNVPAFAVYFYGIQWAGAAVVPMNPLLKSREVEHLLTDSGATLLLVMPGMDAESRAAGQKLSVAVGEVDPMGSVPVAEPLSEPVDRGDDDDCVILYTSGTTGKPKGAQLTQRNMVMNAEITARTLILTKPGEVVMGCLPLFHVFGLTCGLNASVISGACLTLIPRFDGAKALEVIQRDRVDVFEGVPTMYSAMLAVANRDDFDVSSLRTTISGGAPLPVEVLRAFEREFGCMILEGYGLSESSPVACFNQPQAERKPGTIGFPIEGVEMRAIDLDGSEVPQGEVGEIAIRGHNVMRGYWNNEEATAAAIPDGWLRTGDMATVDPDGYFTIVDRKKDLILRGGYNVYPREIEEVLYEHPAVAEAAVIGLPDPSLGEEVGAAVALKADAEATPEELRDFVKERVAAYKYPRVVWLVDVLPKGPTGKILRREVRATGADHAPDVADEES